MFGVFRKTIKLLLKLKKYINIIFFLHFDKIVASLANFQFLKLRVSEKNKDNSKIKKNIFVEIN